MSETQLRSYRLTSMEEPTDEMLHAIMEKVAVAARESSARVVLAKLRNESEHCLYSDSSYGFFEANPAVNVFMNKIACRIVLELAGIIRLR